MSPLSPGLCPARSGLSMPGFGARAGLFLATASLSRGPKPCELQPDTCSEKFLSRMVSAVGAQNPAETRGGMVDRS